MNRAYNCIVVFNKTKDAALFCMRQKDPYKGLYNFVGGKVEPGEESKKAGVRIMALPCHVEPDSLVILPGTEI